MSEIIGAAQTPEKTTKVVILTEVRNGNFIERRYAASAWDAEDAIDIVAGKGEHQRVIATYPPGMWHSIREDGVTVNDTAAEAAFRMAKAALESIAADLGQEDPAEVARQALEEIFAETDL